LGRKIKVEDLKFFSGGGGTNVACALARLGFKTAYLGKVGDDRAGQLVLDEMQQCGVSVSLVKKDRKRETALSVVVSAYGADRTALVYQGACHYFTKREVAWPRIKKAKWFYLAPLREKSAELFKPLVVFAKKNRIKVAINPSQEQRGLLGLLKDVQLLIVNREEARSFGGAKALTSRGRAIVVITEGEKGAVAYSPQGVFRVRPRKIKVIDKTGAGDAFGAGFLAGLLLKDDIRYAINLANKNAEGCIKQLGAKIGLKSRII